MCVSVLCVSYFYCISLFYRGKVWWYTEACPNNIIVTRVVSYCKFSFKLLIATRVEDVTATLLPVPSHLETKWLLPVRESGGVGACPTRKS